MRYRQKRSWEDWLEDSLFVVILCSVGSFLAGICGVADAIDESAKISMKNSEECFKKICQTLVVFLSVAVLTVFSIFFYFGSTSLVRFVPAFCFFLLMIIALGEIWCPRQNQKKSV